MANKPNKKMGEKVSLGYAWYALGVLFFINLVNYIDRLSIGPALEHIKRDFHISDSQIGMIAGSFMLVYAILSLPMGYLSDKGKRTRIVAIGAFVWSIATTLSGFCRSFWGFFFARAAVGSGEGIYAPSGTAIVADYFPKRLRNTSIAIFMSAMILGGALAYIVAGVILTKTERFNMPRVAQVLLDENQTAIDGWKFIGDSETEDRFARFDFENEGGVKVAVVFSRFKEPKEGEKDTVEFRSKLFNIDYIVNGTDDFAQAPEAAKAFAQALNARILEREPRGLERSDAPLAELLHAFRLGKEVGGENEYGRPEYLLAMSGKTSKAKKGSSARRMWKNFMVLLGNKKKTVNSAEMNSAILEEQKAILAQYGDRLRYYEHEVKENKSNWFTNFFLHGGDTKGTLVFYGIMTHKDKLALEKLTDSEQFSKSVGILAADSKYFHVRSDNWRWIFWILGPPGLLFALFAWFLKEPLKGGSEDFLSEEEAKRVEEAGTVNYSVLLKTPSIVFMILSNILATFCVGGLNTWLFPFIERYKGIDSAVAAMKFGWIVVIFAVLGVIFSGIAADKLQKITPRGNNIIIVAGILLSIIPMYVFLDAENYIVMVGAISLTIFFLTWINGPMNALLMSLVEPRLRAMLNGIHILLIHLLGDAISPFIIGYNSDKVNLKYALAMLPLFLVVGAVGFAIAAIFVPKDLKAVEKRMKNIAGTGAGYITTPAGQ